ncbi:MAG: exodeoxyribonuclease VII small subunit [Pyrinomonadaceae bacterium]
MEKTFEQSMNELEAIIKNLEVGDLPLEESLKLFENGVRLTRECRERLIQAERRIEVLMKDADGNLSVADLEPTGLREREPSRISGKRIVFESEDDDVPF